jgi:hypothetical protein
VPQLVVAELVVCSPPAVAQRMEELKDQFGLADRDLNLDLGPLGRLL